MSGPADASGDDLVSVPWKRLTRETKYENPWITVVEDDVELPNGKRTIYGVVRCKDCVGVLPFVDDDHVLLVQQYRYLVGHTTWEMPTGGVHDGEAHLDAAQRELAEEAGYRAEVLTPLTVFHTSKSVVEETAYLYAARGLTVADGHQPDDTEFIRRRVFPFAEVVEMVTRGEITDAMTIIAVLLVAGVAAPQ